MSAPVIPAPAPAPILPVPAHVVPVDPVHCRNILPYAGMRCTSYLTVPSGTAAAEDTKMSVAPTSRLWIGAMASKMAANKTVASLLLVHFCTCAQGCRTVPTDGRTEVLSMPHLRKPEIIISQYS